MPNKVCEDCDRKTQKDVPDNTTSSEGDVCGALYMAVDRCMKAHQGKVQPCQAEWDAFRNCHENHKLR